MYGLQISFYWMANDWIISLGHSSFVSAKAFAGYRFILKCRQWRRLESTFTWNWDASHSETQHKTVRAHSGFSFICAFARARAYVCARTMCVLENRFGHSWQRPLRGIGHQSHCNRLRLWLWWGFFFVHFYRWYKFIFGWPSPHPRQQGNFSSALAGCEE